MSKYELNVEQLRRVCNLDQFNFETTKEVNAELESLGQERALKAIDLGLNIEYDGYNIFALNFSEKKELEYITSLVERKSKQDEIADDLCYVYNFDNPDHPQVLSFPAGLGKEFKSDMEFFLGEIKEDITQYFSGEEYNEQKRELRKKFKKKSNELLDQLEEEVENLGFVLEKQGTGFAIIPLLDGEKPMSEEEYEELSEEEKEKIDTATELVQNKIGKTFNKIESLNDQYNEELELLNHSLVIEIIDPYLKFLYRKYCEFEQVISYLDDLKEDIVFNVNDFKENDDQETNSLVFLGAESDNTEDTFFKYEVNLLVDNSNLDGAPVIMEPNPTYYNLMGRVEYESQSGNLTTNFKRIKPGAFHRANGGYLILEAKEVLSNFKSWQLLKRVLKSGQLKLESLGAEYDKIPLATLDPIAVPIDVKVILIGSSMIYNLLYKYDEDFRELFKIKADFESEMKRNQTNNYKLIEFISQECDKQDLRPLNREAVGRVIEYAARKAGNQDKLAVKFSLITDLLYEADTWAKIANKDLITPVEVKKAIEEKNYRASYIEERIQEMYQEDKILIETQGTKVGEINGLSVIDLGDYVFGRPSKITAVVYQGSNGVVNIEREIKMSGKIHNKGVMILTGYLGSKYAQQNPLSLSASLCFEQLYAGIDGDSASSTELYVLLSALAQLPLRQNLAVTGSINQKGEVQPVGGVTEKVEGFFKICQDKGLTGNQGVIIPHQNVKDLMLNDEVIDAVDNDKFHIYAIENVDQGMELLTGVEMGEKREDGTYPTDTIHGLVQQRLDEWTSDDDE